MKKLMTLMLGMALAFGTVAVSVSFAQEQKGGEKSKKKSKTPGGKKKEETPKKGGDR